MLVLVYPMAAACSRVVVSRHGHGWKMVTIAAVQKILQSRLLYFHPTWKSPRTLDEHCGPGMSISRTSADFNSAVPELQRFEP